MKAVIERVGIVGAAMGLRWVADATIYTGEDAEDFGPIALTNRGNAYVFASCEEAGKWVDTNAQYGDFVIHGVKS